MLLGGDSGDTNAMGGCFRRHVYKDLRPYVCTFADCPRSDYLFDTRHEWFEHESLIHRREWFCNACKQSYPQATMFKRHLETKHQESFSSSKLQLDVVVRRGERAIEPGQSCPLCEEKNLSPRTFEKHVGRHMQQIALFVLPGLFVHTEIIDPSAKTPTGHEEQELEPEPEPESQSEPESESDLESESEPAQSSGELKNFDVFIQSKSKETGPPPGTPAAAPPVIAPMVPEDHPLVSEYRNDVLPKLTKMMDRYFSTPAGSKPIEASLQPGSSLHRLTIHITYRKPRKMRRAIEKLGCINPQ